MRLASKLTRIEKAITLKLIANIKYNKIPRKVQIHVLGYSFADEPLIRVFELTRDKVDTKEFKTYFVKEIESLALSKENFTQTVTSPKDSAMKKVLLTTYAKKKTEDKD